MNHFQQGDCCLILWCKSVYNGKDKAEVHTWEAQPWREKAQSGTVFLNFLSQFLTHACKCLLYDAFSILLVLFFGRLTWGDGRSALPAGNSSSLPQWSFPVNFCGLFYVVGLPCSQSLANLIPILWFGLAIQLMSSLIQNTKYFVDRSLDTT